MKVLELLEEIEEIIETAGSFPLTGKVMVDAAELTDIVKEIRADLPDEIQQAQWIKNERNRILGDAKNEYETIINDAKRQAEDLVENDDIMVRARNRAEELMSVTEENIRNLKMSTYDYVDGILFNFQEKMDELSSTYFQEMFNNLEKTFNEVNVTLATNREEIKEMAYKTSMNIDESRPISSAYDTDEYVEDDEASDEDKDYDED